VETKKYTSVNAWILVFIVIGLSLIPLEIFLNGFLAKVEN